MKSNIKAENISAYYNSFCVLQNIDFKCKAGELVAIIGKSGSGKTTFLNVLAGFIPFAGEINIPKNISYVFQNHLLFPWMTVEKNIAFGLENMNSEQRNNRVREMLKKIEMSEFAKKYPYHLSGGQIQRVAFARAMAMNPDVLLLDEPFASLDHYTRENMQSWLALISEESTTTMILVTHSVDEAIFLSDRVIVLKNRRFVEEVKIQIEHPRDFDVRFSNEFLDIKKRLLRILVRASY